MAIHLAALLSFVVLLWPGLWDAPFTRLAEALSRLGEARQLDNAFTLYRGSFVPVTRLPWHDLPTWIALTTPPLVLGLFVLGLVSMGGRFLARRGSGGSGIGFLLFGFLLFGPLGAALLLRPTLYDGWRHFYFVLPALIGIGLLGVQEAATGAAARRVALGLLAVGLTVSAVTVLRYHPHQQVYFNFLAPSDIERRYEIDYWGLSYRDGLEWVLRREPQGTVNVAVADVPGFLNAMMLPQQDRERLRFTHPREARYFLSNHRQPAQHRRFVAGEPPYVNEVFDVRAGGVHLLGVYRLRDAARR